MRCLVLVLLLASACGIDRNIEGKITIDHGVYGLLILGCDTSGCRDEPAQGSVVSVYAPGETAAVATTTSDAQGIYEIALPAGPYTLCTDDCTQVTLPAATRVRYDWTSGPGGGDWEQR